MWAVFALILGALVFYLFERAAMEMTSLGIICVLLIFFHFFPVVGADGTAALPPARILQGFANPALITVVALLVMGQGMIRTGVLDRGAGLILGLGGGNAGLIVSMLVALVVTISVSAFLNNIPVVVIFIPIMEALAHRYGRSVSKLMIPLSYAAVLGGMTTLIGSSTNLLINSALIEMKVAPFSFFDFSIPGLVMAAAGLGYVIFIAPRLLPDRAGLADDMSDETGRHFVAQITVSADSKLVGKGAPGGHFASLPEKTLRLVQRGEQAILPPFEDYLVRPGDVLVVAATRKALAKFLAGDPGLLYPNLEEGRSFPSDTDRGGRWHRTAGRRRFHRAGTAPPLAAYGAALQPIGPVGGDGEPRFRHGLHCQSPHPRPRHQISGPPQRQRAAQECARRVPPAQAPRQTGTGKIHPPHR